VTRPFGFEGEKRRHNAEDGIAELQSEVDTLIVIPNDRLLAVCDTKTSIGESFRVADDVLRQGIQGIAELITVPGDINLDFADVRKIMENAGQALMAIGQAQGENRAVEAAKAAISSPLLDVSIHGARGVLFNVASSGNMSLHELNMAAQVVAEVVDPSAEIIFGTATDPSLADQVKITLIAVGFTGALPQPERATTTKAKQDEDEELRRLRQEALNNLDDTELPSFLRRPVTMR
jgi:cell division protein FtsZ